MGLGGLEWCLDLTFDCSFRDLASGAKQLTPDQLALSLYDAWMVQCEIGGWQGQRISPILQTVQAIFVFPLLGEAVDDHNVNSLEYRPFREKEEGDGRMKNNHLMSRSSELGHI